MVRENIKTLIEHVYYFLKIKFSIGLLQEANIVLEKQCYKPWHVVNSVCRLTILVQLSAKVEFESQLTRQITEIGINGSSDTITCRHKSKMLTTSIPKFGIQRSSYSFKLSAYRSST